MNDAQDAHLEALRLGVVAILEDLLLDRNRCAAFAHVQPVDPDHRERLRRALDRLDSLGPTTAGVVDRDGWQSLADRFRDPLPITDATTIGREPPIDHDARESHIRTITTGDDRGSPVDVISAETWVANRWDVDNRTTVASCMATGFHDYRWVNFPRSQDGVFACARCGAVRHPSPPRS